MQTVDWCDEVTVIEGEEDHLEIKGADLPTGGDNLVWKAVTELEKGLDVGRPPLRMMLNKRIPVAAGLGGGSADAAAVLKALGEMLDISPRRLGGVAPGIGSDVPAALAGGSLRVTGFGEKVSRLPPLMGFAVALAVPDFPVLTADVYRMWDDLAGPRGRDFPTKALPPVLRSEGPFRNDLHPAALRICPDLGDAMALLSTEWGRPVAMSGSGPSLFAFFLDSEEARSAARGVRKVFGAAEGADLFPGGPRRVDQVT
jgi:4-diphosphocytidyl-2-C-methyl-D-erythritol kinase